MTGSRSTASVAVVVKVRSSLSRSDALGLLRAVRGVARAVATFPGEEDSDLAALYHLRVAPAQAEAVLDALMRDPRVVYAERSPRRKLR